MLRRIRLPARRKGAGVRSRLELAPAAYCASAVEAMESFLPGAGSTGFWAVLEPVSWARVIRGRLPAIGRPNAEILHHDPPPAYACGQAAVGGAEPWPQVHPGILRGVRAAAGL
jgi:hypothetical protein